MKYRLLVKDGRKWKIGLSVYDSLELAEKRAQELLASGIKSKPISEYELFH